MSFDMEVILDALKLAGNAIHAKACNIAHDLPFLATILYAYTPFVFGSLIAYSFGSRAGLRLWIALQQAPQPTTDAVQDKIKIKKYKQLIFLIFFAIIAIVFLMAYVAYTIKWGYLFLSLLFIVPLWSFFANAFGWVTYSVHRTLTGAYLKRIIKERSKYRRLLTVSSIVISIGAVVSYHLGAISPFGYLAFTAWVYNLSSSQSGSSIRFTFLATLYALIAFSVTQWNILQPNASQLLMNSARFQRTNGDSFSWFYWTALVPAVYASLPGVIISTLLRFDYQKHLDAHPEINEFSQLEIAPEQVTPSKGIQLLGTGIILPARAPRNFRKTYYRTALTGWGLGQLLVILSYLVWKPVSDHTVPAVNVMMHLVPASLDIMFIFIFITSLVNGDFKKLAVYKEAWKIKPKPAAVAAVVAAPTDADKEKLIEFEEDKVALVA